MKQDFLFSRSYPLMLALVMALFSLQACKSRDQDKKKSPKANIDMKIPPELAAKYKEDAHRLAVREYNTSTRNEEPQIKIPADRVSFFYNLLAKAYLLSEKDAEVPSIQGIHTFPNPNMSRIMVILEKDAEFADDWKKGQRMTRNLHLNQIMSENGLKVSDCHETGSGARCIVSTNQFVNTKELAFVLTSIEGIKLAEPDGVAGDGNNIEWGSEGKNHMALKFSKGTGDCPSGCIYRKYWIFYWQDGNLTYTGTRGELPSKGADNEEE